MKNIGESKKEMRNGSEVAKNVLKGEGDRTKEGTLAMEI